MVKKVKDYYSILEVSYDVSQEDLKRAYYFMAKMYHPDINPKTGNLFKEMNVAYQTLSDPVKRREYDLSQGIKSSIIKDNIDKTAQYSEYSADDISNKLSQLYDKLKNKKLSEEDLTNVIIEQLNIVDDGITQFAEAYIKAKREEDVYNKKTANINDDDFEFPFNWYEENQYYVNLTAEPLFKIIEEFQNYKFEQAFKGIWNRSVFSILGVIFVYLFTIPLIIRNKLFKKYLPTNAMKTHRYKIKWLKYFVYLLCKNNLTYTINWSFILFGVVVSKLLANIGYYLYLCFDRIIKYFIFPIAYAFRWILLFFAILWLLKAL